jgi:hypothetical protein
MTKPTPREFESKDYSTGRRTVTHDIDVPDRQPHEPHSIRAQARETGTNEWSVSVTHGPHDEKDEQGSYYRHISSTQFSGPLGKVKSTLRRSVNEQWKGLRSGTR